MNSGGDVGATGMRKWLRRLRGGSKAQLSVALLALWKLLRHADTPRSVKLVALLVLAYALSPIDLIPDFIPVLGLLDDLVLIPIGVALVVWLTPQTLWEARLREAQASAERLPRLWWGVLLILAIWALLALVVAAALLAWVL